MAVEHHFDGLLYSSPAKQIYSEDNNGERGIRGVDIDSGSGEKCRWRTRVGVDG